MRRGRINIIIDVLEIAKVAVTKTRIVYRANLNFKLAENYLDLLQKQGLIENKLDKYIITEKGRAFLDKAHDVVLGYSFSLSEQPESLIERRSQPGKAHMLSRDVAMLKRN